jgi:tRNA pseudouridine32 synthase / 23S rRNA pseudouridine746 synthase
LLSNILIAQSPDWIALNKPAGVLSVPGRLVSDSMLTQVRASHGQAYAVHRLDQATSGILLIALNQPAARALGLQFEVRQVGKRYEAVVAGRLKGEQGEIDAPLIADWPNRPMQKIDFAAGKPSLTQWDLLHYDASSDTSRLSLTPVTGRSHQLRVHLQYVGHPIVGDALYGGARAARLMLHASELSFTDPATSLTVTLQSDVPF